MGKHNSEVLSNPNSPLEKEKIRAEAEQRRLRDRIELNVPEEKTKTSRAKKQVQVVHNPVSNDMIGMAPDH